jgi:hypothetical protein
LVPIPHINGTGNPVLGLVLDLFIYSFIYFCFGDFNPSNQVLELVVL